MQTDPRRGYEKDRFPELQGDSFDCGICYQVCKEPKECVKCGSMYCAFCIDDWVSKKNECPVGCTEAKNNVRPVTGALAKIYKNLDIKCKSEGCGKVVKLCDLVQHELVCGLPKCLFFDQCGNYSKADFKDVSVCSPVCHFMSKIKSSNSDFKKIYEEICNLSKNNPYKDLLSKSINVSTQMAGSVKQSGSSDVIAFKWDTTRQGQGIEVSSDKKAVFLKENAYMFRSIIGDTGFTGGVHYWEIIADNRTENELKIGVTTKRDFNFDTAFADYEYGFSYYGLGQLRHGSNSLGAPYGKKFKKDGVLGVCLDMNKGTLSFSLNGESFGEAYKDDSLKKGPIFAAVALLHQAGCKLESGKPVPSIFSK